MQRFVISGGFGLLGQRILRHIIFTGRGRVRVMVLDTATCVQPADDDAVGPFGDEAVSVVKGDLGCASVAAAIKSFASAGHENDNTAGATGASMSVFHLASVMSGQGEQDFDEALRVNVDGKQAVRKLASRLYWLWACM